jgi:GT2 family glycosyltransferase
MADDFGVDIVIPTWNGWSLLECCLQSLVRQDFQQFTVTVVDNGSADATPELLRQHFPEVRIVEFPENRGFSAAVNAGIQAGTHPLVFLINNDVELDPGCLQSLVNAARKQDNMFFAAKMLSFDKRHILDGAGDSYLRGGVGYRLGTMEADGGVYDVQREVFGACAGAALYRRSFFTRVGYFDEDFFAYLEDVDLNLRANRLGLRCLYVPAARVFHVGSATTGSKINPITVRLSTRNTFFVLLKNYSFPLFFRCLPAIAVYQCLWCIFCLKKHQFIAYLLGLGQVVPNMLKIRRKHRKPEAGALSTGELVLLLRRAEGEVVDSIMRRRTAAGKGNLLLNCYRALFL